MVVVVVVVMIVVVFRAIESHQQGRWDVAAGHWQHRDAAADLVAQATAETIDGLLA